MANLLLYPPNFALWSSKSASKNSLPSLIRSKPSRRLYVKAFFFNPTEDPVVKEALKEPVAFMGGMFAGILRLDLNEDPLKEWVKRTVEASGVSDEQISGQVPQPDDEVQQIDIE